MPNNPIITPQMFAIILVATVGQEVGSFIIQMPQHLLIEAQSRAVNFGIQYEAMTIRQTAVWSKFPDPTGPGKLFVQGVESLTTLSTSDEAASKDTIASAVSILSSLSSKDPNAFLAFGGFLLVLAQNVLLLGSQVVIFFEGSFTIYVINNILIRVITEIRIERKRRKLKLSRGRFKFNIFRKEENKDFVFKYLRFKKRKLKFLSREILLPIVYQKESIIKYPVMVKSITI
jgi:hypothetical protein